MQILSYVASLGCLVCLIMVVIKMYQKEGALKAVLGFICGIYAFIWGWMNSGALGLKNLMLIWTVLILASIVLGAMGGMAAFSAVSSQ